MPQDGVIVDTSVLISFLRDDENHTSEVIGLLEQNRLVTTGIIIAELLQGVKSNREEQAVAELLQVINPLEVTTSLWTKAGKMASALRREGITLPLTDVAIATLAMEHGLAIFTLDRHFEQIPGVRLWRQGE